MHGLVNVVFVGALIFYIVTQIGRRRSLKIHICQTVSGYPEAVFYCLFS